MVGWHHQLDGHEQAPGAGDGQGSLACCSPWDHKKSDITEWLNWTELSNTPVCVCVCVCNHIFFTLSSVHGHLHCCSTFFEPYKSGWGQEIIITSSVAIISFEKNTDPSNAGEKSGVKTEHCLLKLRKKSLKNLQCLINENLTKRGYLNFKKRACAYWNHEARPSWAVATLP